MDGDGGSPFPALDGALYQWLLLGALALVLLCVFATLCVACRNARKRLPISLRPHKPSAECYTQTDACLVYEPIPAEPVRMTLALLVDSSASVGEANFRRAKAFLLSFLRELEASGTEVAVVRFESTCHLACPLGPLRRACRALEELEYVAGETFLAEPLDLARDVLQVSTLAVPGGDGPTQHPRSTVLVVTDGRPNDPAEAHAAASALRAAGHRVCFLGIGPIGGSLDSLASKPSAQNVFCVKGFEALEHRLLLEHLLAQLVEVQQRVYRVKCTLPIALGEPRSASDFLAEPGMELVIPAPVMLPDLVAWGPKPEAWTVPRVVGLHTEAATTQTAPMQQPSADAACDARVGASDCVEAGLQTEPSVVAEFAPGRPQALDLVLLVDSSASVGAASFRTVKDALRALVVRMDMPPCRVALVRFESRADTLLALEGEKGRVLRAIQDMPYVVGETKLAPALKAALRVLELQRGEGRAAGVLVVTDGEPNDREAALKAAEDLREDGARVVFVGVGPDVAPARLAELAGSADRVLLSAGFANLHDVPSQALDLLLERPQVPVRAKCVGLRVDAETVRAVRNVDDYDGVEVLVPRGDTPTPDLRALEPQRIPEPPRLPGGDAFALPPLPPPGGRLSPGLSQPGGRLSPGGLPPQFEESRPGPGRDAAATQHCLAAILDDLRTFGAKGGTRRPELVTQPVFSLPPGRGVVPGPSPWAWPGDAV